MTLCHYYLMTIHSVRNMITLLFTLTMCIGCILLAGACRSYKEPVWLPRYKTIAWKLDRFPLKVWLHPDMEQYRQALDQAIADINREVGCPLLSSEERELTDDTDIGVFLAPIRDPRIIAEADWILSPNVTEQIGLVKYFQPGDLTEVYVVFYHELGHVLGLSHDGYVPAYEKGSKGPPFISIMANNVVVHTHRLDNGEHMPRLSDVDADALRGRYCL